MQLCAECDHVQHTDRPLRVSSYLLPHPSQPHAHPPRIVPPITHYTCEHLPHPRIPTFFSNCIVWQSRADSTGDAPVAGPAGTIIGGPPKNANGAAAAVPSFASLVVIALAAIGL